MTTVPKLDVDIFSDEVLDVPWPAYRSIRDAGPVVRLEQETYDVYAIGRFEDVRAALRDWQTFSSAKGIAFNEPMNETARGTILCDPPEHDKVRGVMLDRLRLSEVRVLEGVVQSKADALVASLVERGSFDAVTDLAERLVAGVMGDLIGISGDVLDRFATEGYVFFTTAGPANKRTHEAFPLLLGLVQLIGGLTKEDMAQGSMGWDLYEAAERGQVPEELCATLLLNYVGPAFETTINAIGNAVWLLARESDEWAALKSDATLVSSAVNEALRVESPIQIWGRYCHREADFRGVTIPAGSRVAILFGAGNRDERNYRDPDRFDVRRKAVDHLAFGHGIHTCLGAALARAEVGSVITALLQRASRLECGEPVRRLNNTSRGLASLRVSVA
jgi:cytochrome P450